MPVRFLVPWVALALCACVGGERVKLDAKSPPPVESAPPKPVAVSVSDDREEVRTGDKKQWYLGDAPGGDRELSNHQLVPLHAQLRVDLTDELKSLGFDPVLESDVRKLEVSIREWRFDAAAGVLRYRIEARVLDRDEGSVLAQSMLQENLAIDEESGKKMKTALGRAYDATVHGIVRDNATVLAALRR